MAKNQLKYTSESLPLSVTRSGPIQLSYNSFPVQHFAMNHSSVASIADGLTVLGYDGINSAPSVNLHPKALQARALFPKIFRYRGNNPHMLLIMDKSTIEDRDSLTQSVFNRGNAECCFNILRLLHRNGFSLREVAVQTPCHADLVLLKSTQQTAIQHFQKSANENCKQFAQDLGDLTLCTSDDMRDLAYPFVVLSIPNTNSIGFLQETARMIMAVSRAQFGIVIICNFDMLCARNSDNKRFFRSSFFELLVWLVQGKNFVKLQDLPKNQQKDWKLPFAVSDDVAYTKSAEEAGVAVVGGWDEPEQS